MINQNNHIEKCMFRYKTEKYLMILLIGIYSDHMKSMFNQGMCIHVGIYNYVYKLKNIFKDLIVLDRSVCLCGSLYVIKTQIKKDF